MSGCVTSAPSDDRQKQVMRAFAPSDVETLLSLPEMEVKYRLLRNEWLTLHSRLKQADERVFQAERAGHPWEIEDARANRANISTRLGVYRRLTVLARARAEAEIYQQIAHSILPIPVRQFIEQCVEDVLQRDNREIVAQQSGSGKSATVEDYRALDELLAHWTAKPNEAGPKANADLAKWRALGSRR